MRKPINNFADFNNKNIALIFSPTSIYVFKYKAINDNIRYQPKQLNHTRYFLIRDMKLKHISKDEVWANDYTAVMVHYSVTDNEFYYTL